MSTTPKTTPKLTLRAWLAEGCDLALPVRPLIRTHDEAADPKRLEDPNRRARVRLATVRETPTCRCPHAEV